MSKEGANDDQIAEWQKKSHRQDRSCFSRLPYTELNGNATKERQQGLSSSYILCNLTDSKILSRARKTRLLQESSKTSTVI